MPIPTVTELVAQCWDEAETKARDILEAKHPDKDEEFITEHFHGEFRGVHEVFSKNGAVRQAFLRDLKSFFWDAEFSDELDSLAHGISATVTLHSRKMEKKTGGDIGLVLIRPTVSKERIHIGELSVDDSYGRGLLCQAKIKRRPNSRGQSAWGDFSQNQKKVLADRTDFLSLLLYEYKDGNRKTLMPFSWQLCTDAKLDEVSRWLKAGVFPNLTDSSGIIRQLGKGKVGTDKKEIIEDLIKPNVRSSLVIRIGWPLGGVPPQHIHLTHDMQRSQLETVHINSGR